MQKKRILILVNHDVVIYNFRLELVQKLLSEGYEVYVSSPYGERIDDIVSLGCKYVETKINRHGLNIFQELRLLRFYKKIIKKINPGIILTYTIKPNIYGSIAGRALNKPVLANITGLGTAVENGGLMQKVSIILYKYAFKDITKVYFQNRENQQFFIDNKLAVNKHELLPGSGVNLQHFSVLEYPNDKMVEFVFISRIMKEKGIDQYIEAAKYIKKKHPNTRFHVLGFCEEDYVEELNKLQEEGILIYHGMQRDVRKFLKDSHCTIHPTYYPEGMSNVLLESAACGRPIITTDRSGCIEIVDDDINGYVVSQKNSKELIVCIEKFLELSYQRKKEMGLLGRKKVERQFDRRIVTNAYLNTINQTLKRWDT